MPSAARAARALVFVGALLARPVGAQPESTTAVTGVTVIDVERGVRVPDQTVVVTGARITAVGPRARVAVPAGATVIDGRGRFLLPGLWDMHAHTDEDPWNRAVVLPLHVAAGVTGLREMWADCVGCPPDSALGTVHAQMIRLRDDVRAGRVVGPRLVLASAPLDGPRGPDPYAHEVRSARDARDVVADAAAKGYDVVGTYAGLGPAAYAAAGAAARERGLAVGGPVPFAATQDELRAAGQRTRDNVLEWTITCSSVGDSVRAALRVAADADAAAPDVAATPRGKTRFWTVYETARDRLHETFDHARCEREARRAAGDGAWQAPRLVYTRPPAAGRPGDDPLARYVWPSARTAWQAKLARVRRDSTGAIARLAAREREIVAILHRAGVPLLAATETHAGSGVWGFAVHDELAALVAAGLAPAAALRAATLEPARALGMEDSLGTVAPGKLADLLLLDADPLADVAHTTRIRAVIVNGRLHDRTALDALLADVARAVAVPAPR